MSTMTIQERLRSVPIFAELSKAELRSISRLMTPTKIRKGRALAKQGQIGREFIVILEGEAKVERDGHTVATLHEGDFLGELSVLTGEPRIANVVAATDMQVQVLTRTELLALLDSKPVVAKKMLMGILKRYREKRNSIRSISQK